MTKKLAIASCIWLVSWWVAYATYLRSTTIDLQSVYMGHITMFAALVLANTGLALALLIPTWIRLVIKRDAATRTVTFWAFGSLAIVVLIFSATRSLVNVPLQ